MNDFVADTHALFWYLMGMPQLGAQARQVFLSAERGAAHIYIPVIVLAELYYLNEKLGQPLLFRERFTQLQEAAQFTFVDFQATDVLNFDALTTISEMHDRVIAGVVLSRNCPCLTRDPSILASEVVQVIWD